MSETKKVWNIMNFQTFDKLFYKLRNLFFTNIELNQLLLTQYLTTKSTV